MAYAKASKSQTRARPQLMTPTQKPGVDRTSKTPLSGKQKVGYAMRGAKKALAERGYTKKGC